MEHTRPEHSSSTGPATAQGERGGWIKIEAGVCPGDSISIKNSLGQYPGILRV